MAEVLRPARLSRAQRIAVGVSVTLGLGLAAYGVAGSYQTVAGLAERRGVPLAPLVPVGIDGGLIGVVVLDLVLSWIGQPIGWLRQFVRVLTVGTVAANAAAGWPDLVSAGLHVAAPLMLLAMVEAGRTVLLRRIGGPDGQPRDSIPVARWVLAPWPTWLMWRRMVLWQTGSFQTAVEAEQERRHAVALLRVRYGRRWRRHAPPELVWMLRSGVSVRDAVARARGLTVRAGTDSGHATAGAAGEKTPEADMSSDSRPAANGHAAGRDVGPVRTRGRRTSMTALDGSAIRRSGRADRGDPLARAAGLLQDQPDMTGADLGRELGVSPRHGLRLKKQVENRRSGGLTFAAD
jgi:hypothetical protein